MRVSQPVWLHILCIAFSKSLHIMYSQWCMLFLNVFRQQEKSAKDRQQHGQQHTTAATAGGWHNARSKQKQLQHGAEYLLDGSEHCDPIGSDGEPYGLTLQDTPSGIDHGGTDLDEYETEEEVQSGGEDHREADSEEQAGWGLHRDRQQKNKRRKHQLVSESEESEAQPSAANVIAGRRGSRQADRPGDRSNGLTKAPGTAGAAGRGGEVIRLDSSSSDGSTGDSDTSSSDSDGDCRGGVQGQQQRQLSKRAPAATAAALNRLLNPGSKRRQVISSSDSEDAPELPCKRRRGVVTKTLADEGISGDSDEQEMSHSDNQDDGHFDECNICGEQGELLMCDAPECPLAYHVECLGLRKVPDGDWICPACRGELQD